METEEHSHVVRHVARVSERGVTFGGGLGELPQKVFYLKVANPQNLKIYFICHNLLLLSVIFHFGQICCIITNNLCTSMTSEVNVIQEKENN